jgi:hypothetical protein
VDAVAIKVYLLVSSKMMVMMGEKEEDMQIVAWFLMVQKKRRVGDEQEESEQGRENRKGEGKRKGGKEWKTGREGTEEGIKRGKRGVEVASFGVGAVSAEEYEAHGGLEGYMDADGLEPQRGKRERAGTDNKGGGPRIILDYFVSSHK